MCLSFMKQSAKKIIIVSILLLISSFSFADENSNSFNVYTNKDDIGNHFYPSGWMGDGISGESYLSFDDNWTSNCHSGYSCVKVTHTKGPKGWIGVYWQEGNWGTVENAGYDLSGATKLTFWAKGENGGEKVEFFVGGIKMTEDGRPLPYPDSLDKTTTNPPVITLINGWREYTIELTSKNLSHVIGGFGFATNDTHSTFYLDDIKFDLKRDTNPGIAPQADAGRDQTVREGDTVMLDGSDSTDPDSEISSYRWNQIQGVGVILSDESAVSPSFTAPDVGPDGDSLVFKLTVTDDSGQQGTDEVFINIHGAAEAPLADAGRDQTVREGDTVMLDGSDSTDPDSEISSYRWNQIQGIGVILSDESAVSPSFTAPDVGPDGDSLVFKLTVTDDSGQQSADEVFIEISDNSDESGDREEKAYKHLYEVMDKFNRFFNVYSNKDEGGNHFYPSGWMTEEGYEDHVKDYLLIDDNWTSDSHSDPTCIKVKYHTVGPKWAGIYWQYPENNWGEVKDVGYDLTGATKLTFRAKGEKGGERVEFFVGGIVEDKDGKPLPYPDSLEKASINIVLNDTWQEYTIYLTSKDLSHVIGGFGFVIDDNNVPNPTFYLDDIKFDLARPDELRLLVSYETPFTSEFDKGNRNASFIYDNALALIAFLSRGNTNDLRRAKILADTFVEIHKRETDGRLRNAYMSGDITVLKCQNDQNETKHCAEELRRPGWWEDEKMNEAHTDTHTGNLAWVMIALLSYYEKFGGDEYLNTAKEIGDWIEKETMEDGRGYSGGYDVLESKKIKWKSTEHNIDLYAAFMKLYKINGEEKYKNRAVHAKNFVESMWDETERHFWTGTTGDDDGGINYDPYLDTQPLAIIALKNCYSGLDWAETTFYVEHNGFNGFDFNTDRDGVWFEGTAQMAVAYQIANEKSKSDFYIAEIRKAQLSEHLNSNGKGIVAASGDGTTGGPDWEYFDRLHIGATAWYIFAEIGYNPYWGTTIDTAQIPPTAKAGEDQTVSEGDIVTLDGSDSMDSDGEICSYQWIQLEGASVTLSDNSSASPVFTAPYVDSDGGSLTFQLAITDNSGQQSTDQVHIEINDIPDIGITPVADAGQDQTGNEGDTIILSGLNSTGQISSYGWIQTTGTKVTLSDASGISPTFTAPDVGSDGELLTFRLTVTDNDGQQNWDEVYITINDSYEENDDGDDGCCCFIDTAYYVADIMIPVHLLVFALISSVVVVIFRRE